MGNIERELYNEITAKSIAKQRRLKTPDKTKAKKGPRRMTGEFWKTKKGFALAFAAVCVIAAALLLCYFKFRPQPAQGQKKITVEVVYEDSSAENFAIDTDAEYLEQALEDGQELIVEGRRTRQFGLMIETVNGVTASYDKNQAYWAIELEGEPCNYGASQQPVQDGDHYRLVYTAAGTP